MPTLPDPRCYAAADSNPLLKLATASIDAADATQRIPLANRLEEELRRRLALGGDDALSAALHGVSSAAAGRCLWSAMDRVLGKPDPDSALAATVFALPVVFVVGRVSGSGVSSGDTGQFEIPGALPDPSRLARLLEDAGALGSSRNFGMDAGMCTREALLQTPFADIYARMRAIETGSAPQWSQRPAVAVPIMLDTPGERVELRFLTGLSVTGAQAVSLPSAAGDIARWGLPFARELIEQLGRPGLSLLPIPRPPLGWLGAHHTGSRAREDIALQAFLSRALREFRSTEADPVVEIVALPPSAIGIRLVSRIEPARSVAHSFSLHPLDELSDVLASILELLRGCRIDDVRLKPVLSAGC